MSDYHVLVVRLAKLEAEQIRTQARAERAERTFLAFRDVYYDDDREGRSPTPSPLGEWRRMPLEGIEAMRKDLSDADQGESG
jgi:hypothetical protein